ncbi:IPT/TIG domain-containing protein [Actinoplanes couchii]|uniref:IPT/TIG domain-containing protein n=1 Tax=Actinoplanes couchii TaxID=403638 RepID=UPI0019422686|nr:IPT/TIG domain-containing protein [Actinoplanes couchii]MDR6326117.1 hypothetical protein [Actinoplanes couchii]
MTATQALGATLPGTITVSTPTNGKIAADTSKQVVVLVVSGTNATPLMETNVTGVKLGADPDCANIQSYVVSSATTLTVKTPDGGCAASANNTAESISILFGATDTIDKASAITFVNAPALVAAASKPVFTDNSLNLDVADKVQRFNAAGGQTVRVLADSAFAFDPRSSYGLTVTFGGKAGSEVKVYADATSTTPLSATTAGTIGNSLTFKTGAGMSTTDASMTIFQNGVAKTFNAAATGVTGISANPTITSVTPPSGRTKTAQQVVITGTNFDKVAANYGNGTNVRFCGVAALAFGTPAVNAAGTQITVTVPAAVADSTPGLGTGVTAGSCPVQVSDGTPGGTSPVTPAAVYTFVRE